MSKVEFSEICFLFTPIRRYFFFFFYRVVLRDHRVSLKSVPRRRQLETRPLCLKISLCFVVALFPAL